MATQTRPAVHEHSPTATHLLAILAAALLLLWPAFYNHYPLVYPDSVNYISDGPRIAHALLHLQRPLLAYMRSPLYSLVILPFHLGRYAWPVIVLHALVTAWLLQTVVHCTITRRPTMVFLALAASLSILTGLPWVVDWLIPDILAPALFLSLFLLVFARESLCRASVVLIACIFVWAADSHLTHLAMAIGFVVLLGLLLLLWPGGMRGRARSLGSVAVLVAIALVIQVGLNWFLTGSPSLSANAPPFLTARLIGDGPARQLLQQRCPGLHLTICRFAGQLPDNSDDVLWDANGIVKSSTPQQLQQLRREERRLLLATLRTYPLQQARVSLSNFASQLISFDIEGFGNSPWAEQHIPDALRGSSAAYHRSRQSRDALNTDAFSTIQWWTVVLSLPVLAVALPLCWRRRRIRLLGLAIIVGAGLLANAFLTGVLSQADSRYEVRVIWLLPMLAALSVAALFERPQAASAQLPPRSRPDELP